MSSIKEKMKRTFGKPGDNLKNQTREKKVGLVDKVKNKVKEFGEVIKENRSKIIGTASASISGAGLIAGGTHLVCWLLWISHVSLPFLIPLAPIIASPVFVVGGTIGLAVAGAVLLGKVGYNRGSRNDIIRRKKESKDILQDFDKQLEISISNYQKISSAVSDQVVKDEIRKEEEKVINLREKIKPYLVNPGKLSENIKLWEKLNEWISWDSWPKGIDKSDEEKLGVFLQEKFKKYIEKLEKEISSRENSFKTIQDQSYIKARRNSIDGFQTKIEQVKNYIA